MSDLTVGAITLGGRDQQAVTQGRSLEVHYPIDDTDPVVIFNNAYGWEGSVVGWTNTSGDCTTAAGYIGTAQTIGFVNWSFSAIITDVAVSVEAVAASERYWLTVSFVGGR